MTEQEIIIAEMINDGQTLNEIAKSLWLSPRQIHQKIQKLRGDGYFISPIYYDDGNIRYNFEANDLKHTINLSLNEFTKKYIGPRFLFSVTMFKPFSSSLLFASFVLNPFESVFKIL